MKNKKILIQISVLTAVVIALLVWLAISLTRPSISEVMLPIETNVSKGETIQLDVGYKTEGKVSDETLNKAVAKLELIWKTSDESIAKVDGTGNVTGVETGTADITVFIKDTDISATCKVTVAIPVEGVQAPGEMQLTINGTASKEIGAKLMPEDATGVKLMYESSDESIATVDENGMVTAVAKGKCVITTSVQPIAAENEDAETAEAPNYVNMKAETKVYVVTAATGLKLSSGSGSLKVGSAANVSVFTEPDDADPAKADAVKYTSSDETVATVVGTTDGDAAFTIKGVKAGKTTITVEYQGLTATYEVTVTSNSTQQKPSTGNNTSTGGNTSGGASGGSTTPPASGGETTTPDTPAPTPTPAPDGPLEDGDNLGDTHNPGFGTGDNPGQSVKP